MSIMSDFIVATASDARAYAQWTASGETAASSRYTVASYNGLTDLEVSNLWAILTDEEWDIDVHELPGEPGDEDEDSMLSQFPAPLVNALAALQETALSDIAAQWAQSEELDWEPEALLPVVTDLRRLAAQAKGEGKHLYLWSST
ncbi:hypothetical protein [Lysobacter capsici]|uniref:hypothetical protein n=1 Tax=Lysobacter capsici TaxID=435897 RepID=UPI001C003D02|nr:hypothetical protein [Lysobacter capsici]QWF17545.1 hypothetical protein KME82_01700 [Lysobacter capsici]